jgi:lysophospholipase L1-like esterase
LTNVANNIYIKPNFAHPNQLGHQLIADRLASWIR